MWKKRKVVPGRECGSSQPHFPVFFRGGPAQAGPKDWRPSLAAPPLPPRLFPCLFLCLCLGLALPGPARAERLAYALSWGILPVGGMELETGPGFSPAADHVLAARLSARSNTFVDLFLPVQNAYSTSWDRDRDRSLHFFRDISEGRRTATSDLLLDLPLPRYLLFENGRLAGDLPCPEPLLDPLSLLLSLRRESLAPGAAARRAVTDGRRTANATARALEWEDVATPLGAFRAVRVEVDMAGVEGLFGIRDRVLRIWAVPDQGNLPVKVQATVRMGPWSGDLTARLTGRD